MNKLFKNKWFQSAFLLVVLFVSFTAFKNFDDDDDFEISKNLEIFYTVIRNLSIYYVDKPDPGKLITDNINEMLKELDPYTVYIPENRIEDYKMMATGEYGGIGASVAIRNKKVVITGIYDDSPSMKAGLKVGDEILSISGKSMENADMQQIGTLLKGSANTELSMKIKRIGNSSILNFNFKRSNIKIKNVPYFAMLNDKTGYIKLSGFTNNASHEVLKAFNALKEQGMKYLVFDLRGNPGGLLIEAVKIVNLFVAKNQLVVKIIGRVENSNQSFKTDAEPVDTLINIAVLVNSMSASASEIVSGSLQDLDRAVIVGKRSFGKGLVQNTFPLVYNSQLKLTTAKYYIPSGRCIQALDYSHRNADGSVGKIPDSLITEFHTKNGRKVYDGGGIMPDLEVENSKKGLLIRQLENEFVLFDFVSFYINTNTVNYENLSDIKVDDAIFNEFVEYAKNEGFKYKTKREEQLNKLIEIAKDEKKYDEIKDELSSLKVKLAHNLEKDMFNFKDEICNSIKVELASRFFFIKGKIKTELKTDNQLVKAVELVSDQNRIDALLN